MSDLPAPDAIDGAPHPRETAQLFGHDRAEAEFLDAHASGRMHSGWLISGPRGVGKATLAYRIAAFLLADAPDDGLFGAPPPATSLDVPHDGPDWPLIKAAAHPRLSVLTRGPNQTGSALSDSISVDRVRGLKKFFHLSATDGGRRVVIVDAADDLNKSAANALLKELEEPPARTTLLLVTHQPSRLLPTIRSRCRTLRLHPLAEPDMAAALDQAGFAPDGQAALAALSAGSVGDAIRLLQHDGLKLYADLVALLKSGRLDRAAAVALADTMTARSADDRFRLATDLLDRLLTRLARAGLFGPPPVQAAPGEAQLLAKLSPHDVAARAWADLGATTGDKIRRGRAVNVDPGALMLDALLAMDQTARSHAA